MFRILLSNVHECIVCLCDNTDCWISDTQLLLRKKAAEELKKEQERKAAERRRIIEERCGKPKLIDDANEGRNVLSCQIPFSSIFINLLVSFSLFHN